MVGVVRDIEPSVVKDKRQPGVVGDGKKPGVARDKRSLTSIETKRLACYREFARLCLEPSSMEHLLRFVLSTSSTYSARLCSRI
ncbi:hypothetical protein ARMSODRAFT_960772 [Armillaria solidipes]|uniref:Uncharacterized protein n=1 Tax=Armillaria solidipes TaxID=1076256 RepID=A0A2H3BMS9_9AGAR|nr:hypothetical protein ARMSODRAFT_960772 [Armillaria solidipes]